MLDKVTYAHRIAACSERRDDGGRWQAFCAATAQDLQQIDLTDTRDYAPIQCIHDVIKPHVKTLVVSRPPLARSHLSSCMH